MIGDSITDCGRAQPVGEGLFNAHGSGYVSMVAALLGATYPDHPVRVVNMGTSGNTVLDLQRRWQTDVLDLKPEWLSVMIGINDVWRQFDLPQQTEAHVDLGTYERVYDELLTATRPHLQGLVLATPFYIERLKQDAMRERMDAYGEAVRRLAERHDAILVDTQAAFDRVTEHLYPATLAWDRVHPNATGTAVIAKAFLNAIGFEW